MNLEPTQAAVPSPPTPLPEGEGRKAAPSKTGNKRRGVVLVAVLIVVASLSLAGYHYSDMMGAESKASEYAHRSVQARAFAESGIHYAAAMLSNPDNYNNTLGGNPWNNPQAFQAQSVKGDNNLQGYFSIIAPPGPDDQSNLSTTNFGVTDEGAKINLNSMMKLDPTGKLLHDMLVLLPNLTEDIANCIVAWMGGAYGIQNSGAQDDFYMSLTPPYRCKNGPIDSIDELLLVKGITRDLLYGADWNRNGVQDTNENSTGGFDRGWSAYLTVHSREQNSDATGKPYIYLNSTDLTQLGSDLATAGLSDNMVTFIIMYRQSNATGTPPPNPLPRNTLEDDPGNFQLDLTQKGGNKINSLFDLVNKWVKISKTVGQGPKQTTQTTYYRSPLNDQSQLADQMAILYSVATLTDPAKSPEIPARINVNTASVAVLTTLPGLTDSDVTKITGARVSAQNLSSPAWLFTDAKLTVQALQSLEKYITTRTQVYRVQSVGYFDGQGPAIRLEAVIDTNAGRPRIIAWRDFSELGKGWNENLPPSSP